MASKSKMVTAVFRDRANAQAAYDLLRNRGYLDNEINVLMSDKTRATFYTDKEGEGLEKHDAGTMATEGMGVGGAIGTAVGATLAAVAAIGTTIMLPGLNLLVAGPLAAAFAGGGAGAVAGGVIGALVGWGIPESNAQAYEDALREGGVAIGVTPHNNDDVDHIEKEFKNLQGENVCCC